MEAYYKNVYSGKIVRFIRQKEYRKIQWVVFEAINNVDEIEECERPKANFKICYKRWRQKK